MQSDREDAYGDNPPKKMPSREVPGEYAWSCFLRKWGWRRSDYEEMPDNEVWREWKTYQLELEYGIGQ